MFKTNKTQHSNYWLGGIGSSKFNLASKGSTRKDVVQLASIKNAVTNFVKITTGRHIPVQFSSGTQSYTDGDTVVISASTDDKTLDAVVGLALHEATHCVWREFPDFLRNQFGMCRHVIAPQILLDKVDKLNSTKDASAPEFMVAELPMLIKTLMNVFEDRRIDWWLYREAPGYRPYYEALYEQYWHSDDIDAALQQGKWDIPVVGNYINQLINMTNPWFDTRSLPGMSEIYRLIDVDNINRFDADKGWKYAERALPSSGRGRVGTKLMLGQPPLKYDLDKMPQIFKLAVEVLGLIFDNAIIANQTSDDGGQDGDESDGSVGESGESDGDMEDNLDTPQMSCDSGEGESGEDEDSDDEDSDDEDSKGAGSKDEDEDSDDDSDDEDSKGSKGDESEEDDSEEKGKGSEGDDEEDEEDDSEGDDEEDDSEGDDSTEKKADPKPENSKDIDEDALEEALEKQKAFLDGAVIKDEIDDSTDKQVTAIQQSGAEQVDVPHGLEKTKVMVMNKLTKSILTSGAFPFVDGLGYADIDANWHPPVCPDSEAAVKDGFRMGRMLASRLSIRNQNQVTTFNRRRSGKIDKRRLSNLGHGDDSVFYKLRMTEYQPVLGHMSIDASGSMNGEPWRKAMASAIAIAVAADTIENLDFVISIRAGAGFGIGGATIAIIYDSRVDNPSKIKALFPYITTAGNTPEGLCFAAILETLIKEQHGDRYFINLSDGQPYFHMYSGAHAHKHTREQVNRMRAEGMNILSYFVGHADPDDIAAFKVMYGNDASFIDVSKISSLVSTLNKLFLVR